MGKNELREVNGLAVLGKRHPVIRRIVKTRGEPEIHGGKVWGASFLIMDYLRKQPLPEKARLMELGAGWGLLGIFCAREYGARVTAVDADPNVFPFLETHAIINEVQLKTRVCGFEHLRVRDFRGKDGVLGGDICFWESLVDPLYKAIGKAVRAGVEKIVIADPGRSPFFTLARRCEEQFGAGLLEWDIRKPAKTGGYLLVIESR